MIITKRHQFMPRSTELQVDFEQSRLVSHAAIPEVRFADSKPSARERLWSSSAAKLLPRIGGKASALGQLRTSPDQVPLSAFGKATDSELSLLRVGLLVSDLPHLETMAWPLEPSWFGMRISGKMGRCSRRRRSEEETAPSFRSTTPYPERSSIALG